MLAYNLLPRAIGYLGLTNSGPRIKIKSGVVATMMHDLLDGVLDCYVDRVDWDLVPTPMMPLLCATPLMVSQLTLACSPTHPLAASSSVSAEEVLNWPWALPTHVTSNRMSLDKAFRNCGLFPPVPVIEMAAEPTAFIALCDEINVLTCLPVAAISGTRLVPLAVKELNLEPIVTHFLALTETMDLTIVRDLQAALLRVADIPQNVDQKA